jgi:hypothetical protein
VGMSNVGKEQYRVEVLNRFAAEDLDAVKAIPVTGLCPHYVNAISILP